MKPRYKFAIAICPLCNKEIAQLSGSFGPNHLMWQCPEIVTTVDGGRSLPHYQVEWDKSTGTIAQHVIVGQFYLDTFNTDYQTRIHMAVPHIHISGYHYNGFTGNHVMTVPQLRIDSTDKLLERVKTLVIFS